ncbi:MAG: hypothetical protein ACXWL2_03045 [Candidatus Chromulinivorax sp.]
MHNNKRKNRHKYLLVLTFTTALFASDNPESWRVYIPFRQEEVLDVTIDHKDNSIGIKINQSSDGSVTYNGLIRPKLVWYRYQGTGNTYKTYVYVRDGNDLIASLESEITADIYARARQIAFIYRNSQR